MKTLVIGLIILLSYASGQTVTDFEGNVYNTIKIGNQIWLKENLRSSFYSDGVPIPNACSYKDSLKYEVIYGKLYTWEAAMNGSHTEEAQGACPIGWHVPTDQEWQELIDYLGGDNVAGYKLKGNASSIWKSPNTGTNSSGFNALPGGNCFNCSYCDLVTTHAEFWTSTEIDSYSAKNRSLANNSNSVFRHYNQDKPNGFSVRCIQNRVSTGMKEYEGRNIVSIYPNPGKDVFKLNFADNSLAIIEVFDINMKLLFKGSNNHLKEGLLDLGVFPQGIYVLKVKIDSMVQIKRIVKL